MFLRLIAILCGYGFSDDLIEGYEVFRREGFLHLKEGLHTRRNDPLVWADNAFSIYEAET